jgi:hypothetical protein
MRAQSTNEETVKVEHPAIKSLCSLWLIVFVALVAKTVSVAYGMIANVQTEPPAGTFAAA